MFKPSLLRALPGVMDSTVKDMLNTQIQSMLTTNNECVKVDMQNVLTYGQTLNFNYLFQEGVGPYGDIFGMVKSTLDTTDFNSIIRSLNNGTGTLSLGDVFELKTSNVKFGGISEIEMSLTDAKVRVSTIQHNSLIKNINNSTPKTDTKSRLPCSAATL